MPEQRFPYGPRAGGTLLVVAFFGVCGAFFVWAATNDVELRLPLLSLYVRGGPVYLLAAASFAFVVLAIAAWFNNRRHGPRALILTDTHLEVPSSVWAKTPVRVERVQVRRYMTQNIMSTKVVSVFTNGAKAAVNLSNRTVGDDGYEAVLRWLQDTRI